MLKNKKYLVNLLLMVVILVAVLPLFTFAQNPPSDDTGTNPPSVGTIEIKNPFKSNSIQGFIRAIVNDILLPIGGVVAVLMIIWAGFLYVTAQGNETKIANAHKALLWAVIGAAILLGAWVISEAIQGTINALKR